MRLLGCFFMVLTPAFSVWAMGVGSGVYDSPSRTISADLACQALHGPSRTCTYSRNHPGAMSVRQGLMIQCQSQRETYRCQELEAPEENLIQCSEEEVCQSLQSNLTTLIQSCAEGLYKSGQETIEDLKKSWTQFNEYATQVQKCNQDLQQKKRFYDEFNAVVPAILAKTHPDETALDRMSCHEIQNQISAAYLMQLQQAERKLQIFEQQNPKLRVHDALDPKQKINLERYPTDLREYKVWMNLKGSQQATRIRQHLQALSQVPDAILKKLDHLGIELKCYKTSVQTEIVCKSIAPEIMEKAFGIVSGGITYFGYQLYRLTKSKKVLEEIQSLPSAPERRGHGPHPETLTAKRNKFMTENVTSEVVSQDEKMRWKNLADSTTPDKPNPRLQMFTLKNGRIGEMNNTLKQEDFVTALNHYRHKVQMKHMQELEAEIRKTHPDVRFTYFSDFKSFKVAVEGAAPENLAALMEKATLRAQLQYDLDLKARHQVIRTTDNTENWFRSSLARSDETAELAEKYARDHQPWKTIDGETDVEFKKWAERTRTHIIQHRQSLERQLQGTSLLETGSNGNQSLKLEVVDIIRKNKDDLPALEKILKQKYGLSKIPEKTLRTMQQYVKDTNYFSLDPRNVSRGSATLRQAPFGGIAVDMKALGAENVVATSQAIAQSQNVGDALRLSRKAEQDLTEVINKRRENFIQVVQHRFSEADRKHLIADCSGDGCTAHLSHREMTAKEIQGINQSLAQTGEAGRMRLSAIPSVKDPDLRDNIKKRGEDLEKDLVSSLSLEPKYIQGLVIGVRMGATPELIISEAPGFRLPLKDRREIETKFQELLKRAKD